MKKLIQKEMRRICPELAAAYIAEVDWRLVLASVQDVDTPATLAEEIIEQFVD